MHAVETLESSLGRGPDVSGSPSNRQGEGPVHAVETLGYRHGKGPM